LQNIHLARHGIWLLLQGRAYFLPYEQFPWFRGQPDDVLKDFEILGREHVYWPKLDVDLALEMIDHPEAYPLVAQ